MSRTGLATALRFAVAIVIVVALVTATFAQSKDRSTKAPTGKAAEHSRPKAGHWEGEDSLVSFEVTEDGDIRNFKMNALLGRTLCSIEITALSVANDGSFGAKEYIPEKHYWLPENLTSEERNAKKTELRTKGGYWPDTITVENEVQVEVRRITGRFVSADTVVGKFRILVCGETQAFYEKKKFDEMNGWQAAWKGPKPPPN